MEKEKNGSWRTWALGVSGVAIVLLVTVLIDLLFEAYHHIQNDHERMFERIQKLEDKARRN